MCGNQSSFQFLPSLGAAGDSRGVEAAYHEGEAGGLAGGGGAYAGPGGQGRGRGVVAADDGGGEGAQFGAEVAPLPLHLRHQGLDLPQQQVVLPPRAGRLLLLVVVHARHTGCVQSFLTSLSFSCWLPQYLSPS